MIPIGPFDREVTMSSDEALDIVAAAEAAMDLVAETGNEQLAFDLLAVVVLLVERLTESD